MQDKAVYKMKQDHGNVLKRGLNHLFGSLEAVPTMQMYQNWKEGGKYSRQAVPVFGGSSSLWAR